MKGLGQQVKGKIKEETGDLLDDRSMEIEGKVEKNAGKARREVNNPANAMANDLDRNLDPDTTIAAPGPIAAARATSAAATRDRSGY